ncbi:nuclear transport factor 2 family protein [Sphingopyxis sp. 22461]|uniref:nuclear transport factor 2 family protein n=1 Tax=Sphingopyxis sp. 22461 TaxID=3453923 RepID=UPI003F824E86
MRDEDRRAIAQDCARLVAQYANLNDAGDWCGLSDLYTADGRMARPSAPDIWIEGRDAILAAFQERPGRKGRHLCTNVVIDVIDETDARGECAVALFTEGAAPKLGSFHDRFVRTAGGWKFGERRGSLAY